MKTLDIFKALANESRLQIMAWLKQPELHFPQQTTDVHKYGVCVGLIQEKIGLSQSTTSHYLTILQKAQLVTALRKGQWTYYKRNQTAFDDFIETLAKL